MANYAPHTDRQPVRVDNTAVIPYSLKTADETVDADYAVTFTTAGEKVDLTINITQADWDAAADYSDTVTFNIAYVDAGL